MSTRFRAGVVRPLSVGAFIVVMLTMALATAGEWGANQQSTNPKNQPAGNTTVTSAAAYLPSEVVVKLRTDTARFTADNGIVQGYEAALRTAPIYLVLLDPGVDVIEAANSFSQSPDVEYAHPNYVLNRSHPIQGSYPFSDQNAKGDYAHQYAATQLGLDQVHQLALGAGVVVGVIDGGVDVTHPALGGKAVSGYDFVDYDTDANDEPGGAASGHGTFVAGIIHLVAPSATIRSYRVMDAAGDGDGFTVAQAIEQAVMDGCSIINVSLALTARNLAVRDAIDRATGQGALVIAGAGNLGTDGPVYPAAEANALAVGALDSLEQKAAFSSYGSYVDLSAPGNNVYSAYQKPYYAWWSGTSFSAPFVSGLAALTKQRFPAASGFEIRNRLMATAGDIDAENPSFIGGLGAGVLDPNAALTSSITGDSAVFIPDTLYYTYLQYSQILVVPRVSGVLISTNGSVPYTHRPVDTGAWHFTWVDDSAGTTNDTVNIFLGVTNNFGTYYNRIAFDVVGVPQPAYVTVVLNVVPNDTLGPRAWLNPSEMTFSALAASETMLLGTTMLYSTNAPAAFYAEIASDPSGFLSLIDTNGITNQAVRFGVTPSHLFSPGFYTDTIIYHVSGIPDPALLVVHLNATDSVPQSQDGYVFPEFSFFTAPANVSTTTHTGLVVGSYGTSKAFSAYLLDTPDFTQLTKPNGTTWDSILFDIVTTPSTPIGVYRDTIIVQMPDAPNSPLMAVLTLRVDDTSSGGNFQCNLPGDVNNNGLPWEAADLSNLTAALTTGNTSYLGLMIGNADVTGDCRIDTVDRVMLEMVILGIDSAPGTACGSCTSYDFVPAGPALCDLPGDVNGDGSRWAVSDLVALAKALDSNDISFLGPVIGNSDLNGDCRIDSLDRINLERYFQYGIDSTDFILVCPGCPRYTFFADTIGNQGGDSSWIAPASIEVTVSPGTTTTVYRQVTLSSSNAPANWNASHIDTAGSWLQFDSAGQTNATLTIGVNPGGLAPGLYHGGAQYGAQVAGVVDVVEV